MYLLVFVLDQDVGNAIINNKHYDLSGLLY